MTRDSIRGSSDRSVLILTSLAGSPKHGYALVKDIEEFAGVKLGTGTLYGALAKLERAGLVAALPAQDRRRPYQITPAGREQLRERLSEAARIAAIGLRRIAAAPSCAGCWRCIRAPGGTGTARRWPA
jgi:DNA-binding PadR family transcriptional regulator